MKKKSFGLLLLSMLLGSSSVLAQNPIIRDQFTADPTARVFDGRVYVYPSHDVNCGTNWFCMKDYHVFSSENLVDWIDHGKIVDQEEVAWVDESRNAMWAPDAFEKDGKYYFYFPAIADTSTGVRGMTIGVAVSDAPHGPFLTEEKPIAGVSGIDPNVFIDSDGQAYLYWAGGGNLIGARLKDNMLELESEPQVIESLPSEGLKEGPFLFERNGIYYFTFPRVIENTEALVYGMGDHPLGPFEYTGIIMDEHPSGCWTNHHSILPYNGQWFLFYHHNDYSPDFDKNRSIRADSLFFSDDGTIRKVTPTFRGVGLLKATDEIQLDRYSAISDEGASIAFLDTTDTFQGWQSVLNGPNAWIRSDRIDFGDGDLETVVFRVASASQSTIELRFGNRTARPPVQVTIPPGYDWQTVRADIQNPPRGVQDLSVVLSGPGPVEIDWVRFE